MAKVRKFKDRCKYRPTPVQCAKEKLPDISDSLQEPEQYPLAGTAGDGSGDEALQGEQLGHGCQSTAYSAQSSSHITQYAIRVPNLEAVMDRVRMRDAQPVLPVSALTASLTAPYQLYQPYSSSFFPLMIERPPQICSTTPAPSHNLADTETQDALEPTPIELAGYSGLEDFPILGKIMEHPEVDRIHQFFFRYNDPHCPAAVLLADPLVGYGKKADQNRNRWNDGFPAWLYVRESGDTKWTRDFMAERGGMRQAAYLSRCDPGWRWEQQLGDLLDCRKSLNLWIKVRA